MRKATRTNSDIRSVAEAKVNEAKNDHEIVMKASKIKHCLTEYSSERSIEDLLHREDQHKADLANLTLT